MSEETFTCLFFLVNILHVEGIRYDYKLKYESNLYSTKFIKTKQLTDPLFL